MANISYQVFLSSDGKHTVVATTDNPAEAAQALNWAETTYDRIVERYGLKGGQQPRANGEQATSTAARELVPACAIHFGPMQKVQGKHGPFWSCHQKNPDGSWCGYRPASES